MKDHTTAGSDASLAAYLDLDTALIETRWAERGEEIVVQPGVAEGIARLRQVVDHVVILVEPNPPKASRRPDLRLEILRRSLGSDSRDLLIAECPHVPVGAAGVCDCRRPGTGLIDHGREAFGLEACAGWHISGDQLCVQAGRAAGLRTIRIGPIGANHLSAVHRADHDARDLLRAANLVMMETVTAV